MKLALAIAMAGFVVSIFWAVLYHKLRVYDAWTDVMTKSLAKKYSFEYWKAS